LLNCFGFSFHRLFDLLGHLCIHHLFLIVYLVLVAVSLLVVVVHLIGHHLEEEGEEELVVHLVVHLISHLVDHLIVVDHFFQMKRFLVAFRFVGVNLSFLCHWKLYLVLEVVSFQFHHHRIQGTQLWHQWCLKV